MLWFPMSCEWSSYGVLWGSFCVYWGGVVKVMRITVKCVVCGDCDVGCLVGYCVELFGYWSMVCGMWNGLRGDWVWDRCILWFLFLHLNWIWWVIERGSKLAEAGEQCGNRWRCARRRVCMLQ